MSYFIFLLIDLKKVFNDFYIKILLICFLRNNNIFLETSITIFIVGFSFAILLCPLIVSAILPNTDPQLVEAGYNTPDIPRSNNISDPTNLIDLGRAIEPAINKPSEMFFFKKDLVECLINERKRIAGPCANPLIGPLSEADFNRFKFCDDHIKQLEIELFEECVKNN